MNKKSSAAMLALLAALSLIGTHYLTAQEPVIRGARATPKQIKDSQTERVTLTATTSQPLGRTLQELRDLADDVEKAGHRAEAARLRSTIKEIVRRAEQDLLDKKAQIARLNEEIDDLKLAIGQ